MACASGIQPLQLPLRNVSLSSDGLAFARGVGFEVGTPPQILSLSPTSIDFDSWVFDVADCGTTSNHSCTAQLGGVFDPQKSSTFVQTTQSRWNGTPENALNDGTPYVFFNDEVYFGESAEVPGFPLLTDTLEYADRQSGLGLGQNSSFLKAVVETGLAPSKEWSIWVGSRSIENPIDGMIMIGGYDDARSMGTPAAFSSYTDCSMFLNITNISWNSPTGSSSLMANSSDVLYACVDPYYNRMDLRSDMFDKLSTATGAGYNADYEALSYPVDQRPVGNLTVTLDGGYTTIIPAEELFFPPRGWDDNGAYAVLDDSIVIAEVSNLTDPNYYATLGYPFMTMNYFLIDWESYGFVMTPANRTNFANNDVAQRPSALCGSSSATPTKTAGPLISNHTATSTSTPTPTPPPSPNNTVPIIGGVVGCVLGLALIGGILAFFLVRNRRRTRLQREQMKTHAPARETGRDDATISSYRFSSKPAMSVTTDTTHTYTDHEFAELSSAHVMEKYRGAQMQQVPGRAHQDNFSATSGPVEMPAH